MALASSITEQIKQELAAQEEKPFEGFLIDYKDDRSNWDLFRSSSTRNTEWEFYTPLNYNGNSVYYIPASFVEKGYAWYDPKGQRTDWYWSPAFLEPEIQEYLKPAKLGPQLKSAFEYSYSPTRNGYYEDGVFKTRDTPTSHILNIPNFDKGYIIDASKFHEILGQVKINNPNMKLQADGTPSPIYRMHNIWMVPTGMGVKDGRSAYVAQNQWGKGYQWFTFFGDGTQDGYWFEQGRSIAGKFFDSIGLSGVGDFLEGPFASLALVLAGFATGNPTLVKAGTAYAAGQALGNKNWSQLALTLIAANIPGADGTTVASGTFMEIPQIANATGIVSSTLGVSAATAGYIVRGTIEYVANGFDLQEALKSTAAYYVGDVVGDKLGTILKADGFKAIADITKNVSSAATRAMLLNQSVGDASRRAFIDTAVPMVVNGAPGADKLTAVQRSFLSRQLGELARNPDADLQDVFKRAATDVAVYTIVNNAPGVRDLSDQWKEVAYRSVRGLVAGQDINDVLRQTIVNVAQQKVSEQIKQQEAVIRDKDAQREGWENYQQKVSAQQTFGPQYGGKEITPDMYKTIMQDIKDTTFNADANEKISTVNEARDAALLGGYNNFIFGKQVYTIGGKSLDAADTLFKESKNEFVFDGTKAKDASTAITQAYKSGFNTVELPNKQVYTITPADQERIQKAMDFPGIFDGSKYKDVNEAAKAAAAVDENKFVWNGNVYQVKAPETALNQIKNASTFGEAFALAQKNLGEGNVFEWNGKLYVNRTTAQDAALPFNGNKYEDRGGAAYAAHLAGKDTFTWGGNTWKLPSDYASQISKALGQDPNQSAAETKRLLDANIQAAGSNAIDVSKINLAQTGIPAVDKVIGAISYAQGIGIEGIGNSLKYLSEAQALATGGSFENTLKNVSSVLQTFGERLQPEELAREAKIQLEALNKEIDRAGKTDNPLEATAIIAKGVYDNFFGYITDVGTEIGEETLGLLAGATAIVFAPLTTTIAGGATLLGVISAGLNGAEVFGSSGAEEYRRLKAAGASEDEARSGGILMGSVNAAITIPFEFIGDKALAGAYLDGVKGSLQTAVKTIVNPVTVNAITEFGEELVQGMASRVVRGEEQNVSEDAARAVYAAAVGAGTSAGILTPGAINGAAQIGLDYFGRPVTFDDFFKPPSGGGGGTTTPGGGPPPSGGGGGVDVEGPFPPGAGGSSIDLSTLDFSVPIATLSDGSQLTLGGLQLLLPSAGIDRSVINNISPDLRLSRNDAALFTRQQTFDDAGRFIGYSYAPVKIKDSKPVFERYLIDIGDIPTITETEAKNLLQLEGRKNPTETEVQEVMDRAADENDRDTAKQIADPFTVTLEEVKEAARAAGYAITDEEAAKYVEERLEKDVLAELEQRFDPLATTEQEVREMFEAQGYSPTREEIDRFVQSIPEAQIKGQLQTYVDPRMLYPSDVKALAAQEGYEISDARARELSGQKDKYASLDALRAEFDAGAVTLDEARQMFANTPYKPTDAEIAQFIASKPESQVQQEIQAYVDPRYLTLDEIKAAAKAEGYDISDEEAAALVGQRTKTSIEQTAENIMLMAVNRIPPDMRYDFNNDGKITSADAAAYVRNARDEAGGILPTPQEEAIAAFRKEINPKAVTEAEARAFFNELGYKPTQDELMQFIQSRSEAQVMEDISAYVDPRYVTLEEVKRVANEEGYAITDQEALSLTGQKSQQEILDALRTRADALAVLDSEARQYFADIGYTPTEEEVTQFIGSRPEADIQAELAAYVDPRYLELQEIKDAARAEGFDITDEDAAALVGQKSEEEALAAFRGEIDPQAVIEAEALAFFNEFGYSPNPEELSQFIVSRPEDQVRTDIQTYIDPRQVTREEAEAGFRETESGYQFTPEEINQFIRSGIDVNQEGVLDEIAAYIDPRYVTPEEVKSRYAELGLTSPLEEDISRFTGQTAQEGLESRVQEYLPTAQYNYTAKQLADLQAEQARQKQIQDLNTKFTQDIQALINADPYIDIQTAIDQTIGKIDDPEQRKLIDVGAPPILGLAQEQATKKAERQQKAQQLRQQGVQMLEGFGGVPPTGPQVTSEPHKMDLESLYTGDPGDAFVSPLAPYLAKVEQQSYTGEQPPTPEQPLAEQKDLTDMKRREQGYFTYGQPSEIDQNLAAAADPLGFYTAAAMAGGMRAGGLVPPLMAAGGTTRYGKYAGGGLNLVPHTGKMRVDFRQGDAVTGEGDGQSDDIPAMLADGEFVIPADVVAALGNGSTKAGSDKLYDMMHSIRAEHRSADPKSLPPPAKSPLDYISKRPRAKKRR